MRRKLGDEEMDMLLEKAHTDGAGAFMWTEAASGGDYAAANRAAAESRHRFRAKADKQYGHRKP